MLPDLRLQYPETKLWSRGELENVGIWALSWPSSSDLLFQVEGGEHLQTVLSISFSEFASGVTL